MICYYISVNEIQDGEERKQEISLYLDMYRLSHVTPSSEGYGGTYEVFPSISAVMLMLVGGPQFDVVKFSRYLLALKCDKLSLLPLSLPPVLLCSSIPPNA